MQTITSTTTKSITKTKMLVATLALGAAAVAFLMTPVRQTTVNKTTGTVSTIEVTEYSLLIGLVVAAMTAISAK